MRGERLMAVGAVVLGLACLFIAGSIYLVEQHMTRPVSYFLIAGVALLIAYGILDPKAVTELVRSRQARFGSLSAVITIVVFGILVLANVLASRDTGAIDLTRAKLNTIAPQSKLAVKRLDSDLRVIGYYRPEEGTAKQDALQLLRLYQAESPRVRLDLDRNPDLDRQQAIAYGVRISGSIVLLYKEKPPVVLSQAQQTEQDMTGAILQLESAHTATVCWSVGDGERDLKDSDPNSGFSFASQLVTKTNFKLQDLLLSQAPRIPSECDVLAIVGPQRPFDDNTVKLLASYLDGGGRLFVALDPWTDPASVNQALKAYKVAFGGGLVIEPDPNHSARNAAAPAVNSYGQSPITKDLVNTASVFPQTTTINGAADAPGGVELVRSSATSFSAPTRRDDISSKQPGDASGPFTLMASLEQKSGSKRTRVVLSGSPNAAENIALNVAPGNGQLLAGSLQWLTQQEDLISIPPKPSRSQPLNLTDADKNLNLFVTVLLMPFAAAAGGVAVYLRRRATPTT